MKIESEKPDLTLLTNDQLKGLYQTINTQLSRNLLGGIGLEAERDHIEMLNEISGELNRRIFATKGN